MTIIPTRAAPLLLAVALLCGAVSGCGSGPADSAKVASLTDTDNASGASGEKKPLTEEEILEASKKYAACMREHGVDMPDPQMAPDEAGKGGVAIFSASAADASGGMSTEIGAMDEAGKACADLLPDLASQLGEIDPEAQEKMLEQARAFAKCIREHGVDMPDPQASPGGGMTQAFTMNGDDATMETAQAACAVEGGPAFSRGSADGAPTGGVSVGGGITKSPK